VFLFGLCLLPLVSLCVCACVCAFLYSAYACALSLLCVGIPSASSRPELRGTDTRHLRCVGCDRDFFSSVS